MKKLICITLLLLTLLTALCLPAAASVDNAPILEDQTGVLSASEKADILSALAVEEDFRFVVLIREDKKLYNPYEDGYPVSDNMVKRDADNFLANKGISTYDDVAMLIITRYQKSYYYHLCLYGSPDETIPTKESEYILDYDGVYNNIKSGNLAAGIKSFGTVTSKAYHGRVGASYGIIVTVSAIIALLIGIAACVGVKAKYSMKHRSVDYPLEHFAQMNLTEQSDVFTGSFVTKRVIQSSSGRSGGRRSGGGGGSCRGGR